MPSRTTAQESHPTPLTALLVEDDTLVGIGLKNQLESLGVRVAAQAASAAEANKLYAIHKPDLLLVDIRLGNDDGLALAQQLQQQHPSAVVVISAYSDQELISRASQIGAFGYLVKPVARESLAAQLEVAFQRFLDNRRLTEQNKHLSETLETRKLMDRAKGVLMKRLSIDEPSAHRRLQQESQRRRVAMPDLCRKIIESEELLGGNAMP